MVTFWSTQVVTCALLLCTDALFVKLQLFALVAAKVSISTHRLSYVKVALTLRDVSFVINRNVKFVILDIFLRMVFAMIVVSQYWVV